MGCIASTGSTCTSHPVQIFCDGLASIVLRKNGHAIRETCERLVMKKGEDYFHQEKLHRAPGNAGPGVREGLGNKRRRDNQMCGYYIAYRLQGQKAFSLVTIWGTRKSVALILERVSSILRTKSPNAESLKHRLEGKLTVSQ